MVNFWLDRKYFIRQKAERFCEYHRPLDHANGYAFKLNSTEGIKRRNKSGKA